MPSLSLHAFGRAALLFSVIAALAAACSSQPRYPTAPRQGADIVIDAASLDVGVPRFFTYRYQHRDVNFFVLRLPAGVTSYLDSCLTCYPRHLGYEYKEGYVSCRACDTHYPVYKLERGMGGCHPIRVSGRMENGNYLISQEELQKHAGKF